MVTHSVAGLVLSACVCQSSLGEVTFTILGNSQTFVSGLSADGRVVVGTSAQFNGAYRWTATEGMQPIGASFVPKPNADGTVLTGSQWTPSGRERACRWDATNGLQLLAPFPGAPANAHSGGTGISADGNVIVGWSQTTGGDRAFRWTQDGGYQDLGTLGSSSLRFARGYGVSADGSVVVGVSDQLPFRWTAATGIQRVGGPVPVVGEALAVSGDGQVAAGWRIDFGGGDQFATRWPGGGAEQILAVSFYDPLLGTDPVGGTSVNHDGAVVVGWDVDDGDAFMWTAANGTVYMREILTQAGIQLDPESIWSLGDGPVYVSADGGTIAGNLFRERPDFVIEQRGWVITGLPSPGGAPAFGAAAVLVVRRRRVAVGAD